MREEIKTILTKSEHVKDGSLTFSVQQVGIQVAPGKTQTGTFTITGAKGRPLSGYVVANDIRMKLERRIFDQSPATIAYTFEACGLNVGSKVRGEFRIITTQGEYCLPYFVSVVYQEKASPAGQMKNLFHFANLAKTDWQEAMKFFYSPEFPGLMSGNDRQYLNFYRAMATMPIRDQKMEEFLIRIRKKSPAEYLPDCESLRLISSDQSQEEKIVLTRNGWGYTHLKVSCQGDFLVLSKAELWSQDFIENKCEFYFCISPKKLHGGRNFGEIRFYNEYVDIHIPVCVMNRDTPYSVQRKKNHGKIQEMVEQYLSFAMGKLSNQEWKEKADEILSGFHTLGEWNTRRELFEAQLLISEDRINEAKWILDKIGDAFDSPELSSYYLYLHTLCETDSRIRRANLDRIRGYYRLNPTSWRIAWLLLYLDPEIGRSPQRKWMFLEQQFEKNCSSPLWFLEAAEMAMKNPTLLMRPTDFVLSTLTFMVKYDFLNDEVISQIHYLAGRGRKFSKGMLRILIRCYEKREDIETLEAICELLIRGNKTEPEMQSWYLKGIEAGLWIPKLYECYLLSADPDDLGARIPDSVMRYFVYNSSLPFDIKAFLYAYLIRNRNRYPEMYRIYYPDIEEFGKKQLSKGRVNRNLALIYNEVLDGQKITKENTASFIEIGISREIRTKKKGMSRVILIYSNLNREYGYYIQNGKAYVPVYGQNVEIVLEGEDGGRFAAEPENCEITALFMDEAYWYDYARELELTPEQLCGLCDRGSMYTVLDEKNVDYAARLHGMTQITESYRSELGILLLRYYFEHDELQKIDEILRGFRLEHLSDHDRGFVLRCMVLQGHYEEAFHGICHIGLERVETRTLVRMCSRHLNRSGFALDDRLLSLVYYSFCRGKYDDSMLIYLQRYFLGTSEEMSSIFDACLRFDVEPYEICEKLLLQMRMSGNYLHQEEKFFLNYWNSGGKDEICRRYLIHCAEEYFAGKKNWTAKLFEEMPSALGVSEEGDEVVKLAVCRYLSEKKAVTEAERDSIRVYIYDLLIIKHIYFGFFYKFRQICPEVELYHDRVVLEYAEKDPGEKVLHYLISQEGEARGPYMTEVLQSPHGGVYARSFVLFFGESLHYYITEKHGDREDLVASGVLTRTDTEQNPEESRFMMINRIVLDDAMSSWDMALKELKEYGQRQELAGALFALRR